MYEVVVSLVGLALLLSVLVFDCRVRVEATKSAEASHFSARLLQQACAALSSASSSVSRDFGESGIDYGYSNTIGSSQVRWFRCRSRV
jgi:hypothetical protein